MRYEAYGTPTALPAGDTDRDGDTDATDVTQIDTWISGPTWDARGDLDFDNDVDAADKTLANGMSSANGGRGILSDRGNRKGYAGFERELFAVHDSWQVRHRMLDSEMGRWTRRDPLGHIDDMSLYQFVGSNPIAYSDPFGLFACLGLDCPDSISRFPYLPSVINLYGEYDFNSVAALFLGDLTVDVSPCGTIHSLQIVTCKANMRFESDAPFFCEGFKRQLRRTPDPVTGRPPFNEGSICRLLQQPEISGEVPCPDSNCECENLEPFFGFHLVHAQIVIETPGCNLIVTVDATVYIDAEIGDCCCN